MNSLTVRLLDLLRRTDDRRLLLKIVLLFMPMAAIGTLLHEGGHIVVAQALGYETTLYYGSMSHSDSSFARQADWSNGADRDRLAWENLLITVGGPAQSILTGSLGLLLLWHLRRKQRREVGSVSERWIWLATLMALFWGRQAFNGMSAIFRGSGKLRGDEYKIASYFDWPFWSVLAVTGAASLVVCVLVIRLQPSERRLHMLVGAPIGSLIGFALWYMWLGPQLLP